MASRITTIVIFVLAPMYLGTPCLAGADAIQILETTGVKGGLIVHVGCGDGKLTAALCANDSPPTQRLVRRAGFLVHGLDKDAENIKRARKHISGLGLYGKVSVDHFKGKRLPYTDNLVNLIVSEQLGEVPMDEVMRVLCPNGVAYIKQGGKWKKTVKPRPKEIDEWTHYLYDATNNAVSHDTVVGLPYHIQWTGGLKWARSHDHLSSISAAVSAGGRIFCIADEGPTAAVILPAKWVLVARDAFNGVVLWKRPIGPWEEHLRGFRNGPAELTRRLVAVGDRVYVTLGYGKPVTAIDAATGKTVKTYEGTEGTLEIVYHDDVLFLVAGDMVSDKRVITLDNWLSYPQYITTGINKSLVVIKADTHELLWRKSDADTAEIMPTTLAVSGGRVFFQNTREVICLSAMSGSELWCSPRPISVNRWTWSTPTLVVYNDVLISADRDASAKVSEQENAEPGQLQWTVSSKGGDAPVGEMIAFSAKTGEKLWSCECRETYNSPVDVLVTGGLVWTGDLVHAKEPGITMARDVITGQVKKKRPPDRDFFTFGMGHHRCYRNKATDKYLLLGRSGVEFVDLDSGEAIANHFVRGACQYGIFPANGLLYAPPHSCACFIEAKLNGFNALAPKRQKTEDRRQKTEEERLQRGLAYDEIENNKSQVENPGDWPTYRHDIARSGYTRQKIPAKVKNIWQTHLPGRLSNPVAAEGMTFVTSIDSHTVHALDADNGKQLWGYTAGGRVDSPPTIYQGLALFGSADGWIYCLRSSDGELAWRFRAAPEDRRIVSYGQLESVWPVHGSVLVLTPASPDASRGSGQAVIYFAAGRSSYIDGGMYLYGLDPRTGKVLSKTNINNRDPQSDLPPQNTARGVNMPGALPDVLSSDGQFVYMRHMRFNRAGAEQEPDVTHLFSPAGFLDGSWWHRTYWLYGTDMNSGWGGWTTAGNQAAAGRLLVLDESSVYSFGRLNQYARHGSHVGLPESLTPWPTPDRTSQAIGTTHYQLFACSKHPEVIETVPNEVQAKTSQQANKKSSAQSPTKKSRSRSRTRKGIKCRWSESVGLWVRAMVLADKTLFLAGPPVPTYIGIADQKTVVEAFEGKKGAVLYAVSAEDGKKLAEYDIESLPVYDGMIAANGRLYISTQDGRLICMGK